MPAPQPCPLLTDATSAGPPCSSYLLSLVPASGKDLTLSYWPATTDETKAQDFASLSKASPWVMQLGVWAWAAAAMSGKRCSATAGRAPALLASPPAVQVCSGTVTVKGGTVVGVSESSCPAGSYSATATDGCRPW